MSDSQREDYIKAIELENEMLRARIRDLEKMYGFRNNVPVIFGLTGSEAKILSLLMARDFASKQQLLDSLMADRGADDEPEIKIVDVFICKIRVKLKPFDVPIETLWGRGYRMGIAAKGKVSTYLAAEGGMPIAPIEPLETFTA